jgi:excisionase family DNA binding protein
MSIDSTGLSRKERRRERNDGPLAPLLVSVKTACELLDIGNTTAWKLIKDGKIETVHVGKKRLCTYASIMRLATPPEGGTRSVADTRAAIARSVASRKAKRTTVAQVEAKAASNLPG